MLRSSRVALHGPLKLPIGSGMVTVGSELLPMIPSNNIYSDSGKLRKILDDTGYLYFKNIVPRDVVSKAFEDIANQMISNEWVRQEDMKDMMKRDGFAVELPVPKGDLPPPKHGFEMTTNINNAVCGPNIMTAVRQVYSGGAFLLPHKNLEVSPTGERHGFHMDSVYAGRGSRLMLTAWVALHDINLTMGGLAVVNGSNTSDQFKSIRGTYGQHEVESGDIHGDGSFTTDPEEILSLSRLGPEYGNAPTCPIISTSFEPGDVVITTVYSMHSFLTNTSPFWRISGESKWIMEGDDVGPDPRYIGNSPTGLSNWQANCENRERYPRSMDQAKVDWGLKAAPESIE